MANDQITGLPAGVTVDDAPPQAAQSAPIKGLPAGVTVDDAPAQAPEAEPITADNVNLPGSTPQLRAAVAAGKAQGPAAAPRATQFEQQRNQTPEEIGQAATDTIPVGGASGLPITVGDVRHFWSGIKSVIGFGKAVATDINNPNKPLFISNKGAQAGSEGESTLYKYGFAPQVEEFNRAQENERLSHEAEKAGHYEEANRYHEEAVGHLAASYVPMVGPWVAGHAQRAGETGDVRGEIAEFAGEAAGGELLHKAGGVVFDKVTRMTGDIAEGVALKAGASPKVAEAVGNVAAIGTLKPIDAHLEALDEATDQHIAAEKHYQAKTQELAQAQQALSASPDDADLQDSVKDAQKALDRSEATRDAADKRVNDIQDDILRELDGNTWARLGLRKIGDIMASTIGVSSDPTKVAERIANVLGKKAGQEFKANFAKISEDWNAILNADKTDSIKDPQTAADAIDRHVHQNIEAPLQREAGAARDEDRPVVNNFLKLAEERIDKFFSDNPGKFGSPEEEDAIKEKILDRVTRQRDIGNGLYEDRDPNLYEAESMRQGLKKYEPNETVGFNAAAYDMSNFLRDTVDKAYDERGVKGVKEARTKEAALIAVEDSLRKAQTEFDKQQNVSTLTKLKNVGKSAMMLGGLTTLLLHGNLFGLLASGVSIWDAIRTNFGKDIGRNIERAKTLAARDPNARMTVPQVIGDSFNFGEEKGAGPEGGTGPEPIRPKNMPPPPQPPAPVARPAINHRLGGELSGFFGPLVDEMTYQEMLDRFEDHRKKLREAMDSGQGADSPVTGPDGQRRTLGEQLKLTGDMYTKVKRARAVEDESIAKQNDANQKAYQKELAKYQAKYQVEQVKAAEEAKAKAEQVKKEAEAAESQRMSDLQSNPLIAHSPVMFATEPATPIESADGRSSEEAHKHEHGHIMAAVAEGLSPVGFLTNEHPDAVEEGAHAQTHIDTSEAEEGEKGIAQRVVTILGGAAFDEMHHGLKLGRNEGARSDVALARQILREEGGLRGNQLEKVFDALYDRAKEHVQNPEALAIVNANAGLREAGLHKNFHMSPGRLEAYAKLLEGAYRDGETPTTEGTGEGDSDGAVEKGESAGTGRSGEEQDGAVEEPRAQAVRKSEEGGGESDLVKQARQRGIKEHSTGRPELDEAIKAAGAVPAGTFGGKNGVPEYAMFHDPESGSTLMLPKGEVTPENVKAHLEENRAAFAKANSAEAPEDAENMSELKDALKSGYEVKVQNPDGSTETRTIWAHSFRDALKEAHKIPGYRSIELEKRTEPAEMDYNVPKGKLSSMPESITGKSPVATIKHELGHALVALKHGLDVSGMFRHTAPGAGGGRAFVRINRTKLYEPGTRNIKPELIGPMLETLAGGVAADEHFNGIDRNNNMNFDNSREGGDAYLMDRYLNAAGITDPAQMSSIRHALVDSAKEYLQQQHVSDIVNESAGVREPNLSSQYHMSPQRLRSMNAEAIRRGAGNEPSTLSEAFAGRRNPAAVGGGAGEGVGKGIAGSEGAGQASPAQAPLVQAAEVRPRPESLNPTEARARVKVLLDRTKDALSNPTNYDVEKVRADLDEVEKLKPMFNIPEQMNELSDEEKGLISTRQPSGKKATEDPLKQQLVVGRDSIENAPGMLEKAAARIKKYAGTGLPAEIKNNPKAIVDHFVNHLKDNLVDIWNQVDPAKREATAKWYDSANKFAKNLADKYGATLQQASAAIAAMSPQKDWDQNVSLAERVVDSHFQHQDTPTSPEMMERGKFLSKQKNAQGKLTNPAMKGLLPKIEGKTLGQIDDPVAQAAWVRLHDETTRTREYNKIDPGTGDKVGIVKADSGEPRSVAWGSLNEIAKALSILKNGSRENISNSLGEAHKVRNFYNNIVDPNNPAGHVTIDTHAVAAAHMQPFSGKSEEVKFNFGGIGSKATGAKGLYGIYADAYRQAAAELGIQPRQLQSVAWEAVREEFPDRFKRAAEGEHPEQIKKIWKGYDSGKTNLAQTRQAVRDYAAANRKGGEDFVDMKEFGEPQAAQAPATKAAPAIPAQASWDAYGPKTAPGMSARGNINLQGRPIIKNDDGSHSSEYSFSFDENGKEVLVPTVVDGKFLTPDGKKPKEGSPEEKAMFRRAIEHYRKTGQHMGKFDSPEQADAYAEAVHNRKQ